MPYFKITSDIVRVAEGKTKMDVDFFADDDTLLSRERGFEVDSDQNEGIKAVLSRAAFARVSAREKVIERITLKKNEKIEAEPRFRA